MVAPNGAAYMEFRTPAPLARYVDCTFRSSASPNEPVLPDGCMDVLWDGVHLLLSGPDTRPVWSVPAAPSVIGLRFRPGIGSLFLGIPAQQVRDQRLELGELWVDADELTDRLSACSDSSQCAEILSAAVLRRLPDLEPPDPLVEAAVRTWAGTAGSLSTAELSELADLTPRQVHRRFLSSVGYGPKLLQRVLRLQAFLRSCRDRQMGLAELALRSGYADQAHLTREARLLTGVTPSQLRAARQDVRNVQDARPPWRVHQLHGTHTDADTAA